MLCPPRPMARGIGQPSNLCRKVRSSLLVSAGFALATTLLQLHRTCHLGPPTVETIETNVTDRGADAPSPACGVLITSQGGVGSSVFMKVAAFNPEAPMINDHGDSDGFKHMPATYWKRHDERRIAGDVAIKGYDGRVPVCFGKVLVIVGDPLRTIESTWRRFKRAHLIKMQRGSNLKRYPKGTTLEQIYKSIATSGQDEVGIANYILSWRNAQNDVGHWPEVRLVTTKMLYSSAVEIARWVGVNEKELEPFEKLRYDESKHHEIVVGEEVDEEIMEKVKKVYANATNVVIMVQNGQI
ncbi:hypothetical protein ACHAWF_008703 [Thalassiosira exigua]